jgi:hypothetical protein
LISKRDVLWDRALTVNEYAIYNELQSRILAAGVKKNDERETGIFFI